MCHGNLKDSMTDSRLRVGGRGSLRVGSNFKFSTGSRNLRLRLGSTYSASFNETFLS
jgi:hypothetical protein